jgi:hypothetical protein
VAEEMGVVVGMGMEVVVGKEMEVVGWVAEGMVVVVRRSLAPEVVGMPGSAGCRWGSTGGCCSPPRSS